MHNPTYSYEFGAFVLNEHRRELLRAAQPVSILPKDFDALLLLVKNAGEIIDKDLFREVVWQGNHVTENSLNQSIHRIRLALDDPISDPHYIQTVSKRGYRFIAQVYRSQAQHQAQLEVEKTLTAEDAAPREVSSGRRRQMAVALVVFCLIGALVSLASYTTRKPRTVSPTFPQIRVTRLTNGGAWGPVISPDGKFIAHSANDAARRDSIWLRETSTGNSVQLVPADGAGLGPNVFSRDGSYLYFARSEKVSPYWQSDIYRIPVLGGTPQKVLSNAGGVFPSPDDKQLVFLRADSAEQATKVFIANSDGTGERVVYSRKWPDIAWSSSWSPHGDLLTYSVRNHDGEQFYNTVAAVPVGGGAERLLTTARWKDVWGTTWLPDGSGLLITARERFGDPFQIYYVSYPAGEVRKITDDQHSYSPLSITADSKTIVADLPQLDSNIWVVPKGSATHARQITYGGKDGIGGVAWTPDGRVVFATFTRDMDTNGDGAIWIVDADGRNRRRLTHDGKFNSNPVVTLDGRHIVFSSYQDGVWAIWRMHMDGSEQRQLAVGSDPMTNPYCSPDGGWVVFKRGPLQATTVWKVSIDGGAAVQLTDKTAYPPSVSPDGRLIAFFSPKGSTSELELISASDGAPIKTFDLSPNNRFLFSTMITRWTGDLLTYIDNKREVSNIYGLPARGGPPRQLTDFNTDTIFSFDWSRNGKELVMARGQFNHEIVLLSGFR